MKNISKKVSSPSAQFGHFLPSKEHPHLGHIGIRFILEVMLFIDYEIASYIL